jgi:hypothetical protein
MTEKPSDWIDPRPTALDVIGPVIGHGAAKEVLRLLDEAGFRVEPPPLTPTQQAKRRQTEKRRMAGFRL